MFVVERPLGCEGVRLHSTIEQPTSSFSAKRLRPTIGYVSDEIRLPGNERTFTHRAVKGLSGTSVQQAVDIIDAWYKANPKQLNVPVLKVLWDQVGKPRLAESESEPESE
jgi:hypothetical protein